MGRIIENHENKTVLLESGRKQMHKLVSAIQLDMMPMPNHPDPGSISDCFKLLHEEIDDCYDEIEELYKNK